MFFAAAELHWALRGIIWRSVPSLRASLLAAHRQLAAHWDEQWRATNHLFEEDMHIEADVASLKGRPGFHKIGKYHTHQFYSNTITNLTSKNHY